MTRRAELTQISANIGALDRVLANYGPETKEIRDVLAGAAARIFDQLWSEDGNSAPPTVPVSAAGEILYHKILALSPQNNTQRALQTQALSIVMDTGRIRWLMYTQATTSVSIPLLVVLVLLAQRHFHQLRPVCPLQRDRRCQFVRFCAVGFRRNLLDPGDVYAIHGSDSDLDRSTPRRSGAPRPVAR
jgi:hypothetical protein